MALGLGLGLQFRRNVGSRSFIDQFGQPAAAYSLRDLNGSNPNVIRVRRSSDNAEQDFTAAEVADGTMTAWVNTDVNVYTSDFSSTEDLLEFNGTGAAAQSVAGVDDAYKFTLSNGSIVHFTILNLPEYNQTYTVTLDYYIPSGQTVTDLEATLGTISQHTLDSVGAWTTETFTFVTSDDSSPNNRRLRFVTNSYNNLNANDDVFYLKNIVVTQTTADGHVTTWYDQSLSNDATQSTAASQPKIVSGGSLVTENGKPAVDFDGTDDEIGFLEDISATEVSSIIVAKAITSNINDRFFGWRNSTYSFVSVLMQGNNSTTFTLRGLSQTSDGAQDLPYTGVDYTNQSLISMYNAATWRINGNEFTTATTSGGTGLRTTNGLTLGSRGDGSNEGNVRFQEAIFYPSDQSSNRTGIENNINEYYSIY